MENQMERVTASSVLISVVCVVAVIGLVKVVNWLWLRPKKLERFLKQQGIPGTSYRFFYGDLNDFSSMQSQAMAKPITAFSHNYITRIEPFRHQLMTKFGREFFMWSGSKPTVVISKPELIREAFTKMKVFQKPKTNPMLNKVFAGLLNYEGEKWAYHRRMVNPAFHIEKLKLMFPVFYQSCEEMINKWEEMAAETGTAEMDVMPHLSTLTADVLSRAAFGSSYKEGHKIFGLLNEQLLLALSMMQSVYIPGFRYLPTARNRRFKKINDEIDVVLKGVIEKRKKAMESGEASKDDLLGILMDSYMKDNMKHVVSFQEVIDECKLFYLAGHDTTSILLVWTLILLSKHQEWQARAREEVLQTFENNAPNYESLNHLKTVTMILYEVLRMYPPAPQFHRRVNEDTKLGELSLPADSMLNFQVTYTHRNKELWGEDAEEFNPDRFSQGISKATKGNHAFFPFGWGPRICVGEKFAMTEAKQALSMILQRFSFELSPSYVHSPKNVFTLRPQHGAQIILHRLK